MTEPGAVLLVMMNVAAEHEDELNRWYDEEHVPQRLAFPGFLSTRRFQLVRSGAADARKYLALYELESLDAMRSAAYRASYDDTTPWSKRVTPTQRDTIRSVYEVDSVSNGPWRPGAAVLVLPSTDAVKTTDPARRLREVHVEWPGARWTAVAAGPPELTLIELDDDRHNAPLKGSASLYRRR